MIRDPIPVVLMGRRKRLPLEPMALDITGLDTKGAGTAEKDGEVLQVWGALPQERVMARYLLGRRMKGQAQTVEVLSASNDRVDPPCPSFGTCSACSFQHMSESCQLDWKQHQLFQAFAAADVAEPAIRLPALSGARWNYRRKARLSVRYVPRKGRVLVGFRERDGRFVTDMTQCHTLTAGIAQSLPALSDLIGRLSVNDQVPQLETSCGDAHCALILRHLAALSAEDEVALKSFEETSGIRIYLQSKGPDTVRPLNSGPSRLSYRLEGENLEFFFEPTDFIQVNGDLNQLMVAQAMKLLAPDKQDRVLDLFCGLGNFTLPMAQRCASVLGLEGSEDLVRRARENAQNNASQNASFRCVDLYGENFQIPWGDAHFDLALLDPPRSGAGAILKPLGRLGLKRILYVSCNPETLAQDASRLTREFGYQLTTVGAMDMFPQTAHIEAMALFERG